MPKSLALVSFILSSFAWTTPVKAQSLQKDLSNFASGTGTALYLGAGALLPLIQDGKEGSQRSLRVVDALVTSTALCLGMKELTKVQRPDNPQEFDSFPSCHATASFAVARVQSHYHPDAAWLWYGGAVLISASRVDLNRHRLTDVLTGAVLGYVTGEFELKQPNGLLLFPFIRNDNQDSTAIGLQVYSKF